MRKGLQDAFIANGMLIFGGPHRGGHAACGYRLGLPTLTGASPMYRNELEVNLVALLQSVDTSAKVQINWSTDSNYGRELVAFHDRTVALPASEWSARARNDRSIRYLGAVDQGAMRRECVTVYVCRPWSGKATSNRADLERRFRDMEQSFEMFASALKDAFGRLSSSVFRLGDDELANEFAAFLNPLERKALPFDPRKSVFENFQLSDGVGLNEPHVGFYSGGAYHAVLVLKTLPQATCSGLIQHVTGLPLCNVAVTVNITRLDVGVELARAESEITKLDRALAKEGHMRMESSRQLLRERVSRMATGVSAPFRCQMIVRVWDTTLEGAHEKLSLVKAAILRMNSAKPYEVAFPTSAVNFYRCCTPGWCFDDYTDFSHYADDNVVANLVPVSGSFNRLLRSAEALYDDGHRGLVSISGFSGPVGAEAPSHVLITGKTGSGKSLLVNDMLAQTEPHYRLTVIIDDGNSYGGYVMAAGGKTFVIAPGCEQTFNYLDPRGPWTSQHLADACAVLLEMCGAAASSRTPSVLSTGLKRFFWDWASDWIAESPDRADAVCREGVVFQRFERARKGKAGAWMEHSEAKQSDPAAFQLSLSMVSDYEIMAFRAAPEADEMMRRIAYAWMAPDEMPTHSHLCGWLEVEAFTPSSNAEEFDRVAGILRQWDRNGEYGSLFDGVGSFTFDSSIIHLELGRIPEAAKELRRVAVKLVCNHVRNELLLRPRSERKRLVIEEMASFLEIPDTERIVRDFFERGRKYNVWVIAVIQQIGEKVQSEAFVAILGNTRQAIFLKQTSVMEANVLAKAFQLPDSTHDALLRLSDPTPERGAAFLMWSNEAGRPVVRSGCNIVHPDMMFIAGSSGDQHERRQAAIARGEDLLSAAESARSCQ